MLAYIVIREGSKWTDVFRLVPGRTVTIGRASTNHIVIKDDRSSRCHAEIFLTRGSWTVRDLDSRNGTMVTGKPIRGDCVLAPGDVIQIANSQLAFVYDLSKAFADAPPLIRSNPATGDTVTGEQVSLDQDSPSLDTSEPTTITHRRGQTKFLDPGSNDDAPIPRVGRAAAKLCRLAFELAKQADINAVAKMALNGLFDGTNADAGAVLLVPRGGEEQPDPLKLEIAAAASNRDTNYHRVSDFLASVVLRDGEAALARNIEGDSTLGSRDSQGIIHTTSVICAPIRQEGTVIGLIHTYSTATEKTLDPDDLEFTLAVADNVALAIKNLGRQQELTENLSQTQTEIIQLRKRLAVESEIVGSSSTVMEVQQEIARAAPSRAIVLIRGESGVGKELVARAIHFASPRKKAPFVCLNCAALTESRLESELFGHEKGSFTGATERKIGKFESAHQGTLMLDEIGEMSMSIQSKFLRVLEGHSFERVGGNQPIKVDVRVIAATNRDLEKSVSEGRFRRDLYFRLHVVEILVPALRKRPGDVLELGVHFLDRFNAETGRKIRGFSPAAFERMQHYRWPGNVRELKNVVERAVLLAKGDYIEAEDLSLSNLATSSESGEMSAPKNAYEPATLDEIESRHIAATLNATAWNKSRTAEILGIERSTLDRKIRRYNLVPRSLPHLG